MHLQSGSMFQPAILVDPGVCNPLILPIDQNFRPKISKFFTPSSRKKKTMPSPMHCLKLYVGQSYWTDGSEIWRSPVDMVNITLLMGFHTCQVVVGISSINNMCQDLGNVGKIHPVPIHIPWRIHEKIVYFPANLPYKSTIQVRKYTIVPWMLWV